MLEKPSGTAALLMRSHPCVSRVHSSSFLAVQMVNLVLFNHFKDPLGEILLVLVVEATVLSPSDTCRSEAPALHPQRMVSMAHPLNCAHKQKKFVVVVFFCFCFFVELCPLNKRRNYLSVHEDVNDGVVDGAAFS